MFWNTVVLALVAIRRNLLRSFLTVLGIVIGVAAVVTMITVGNGATRSVQDQISAMGSNLLIVIPGQMFGPGAGTAASFKLADADTIRSQISGLQGVAPTISQRTTVVYLANNWTTGITGSTAAWFANGGWTIEAGRVFNDTEERAGKAVCVLGETVRRKLFGHENPVGSVLRVKGFSCEVIGLLGSKGQSAMGSDQDDLVVMPLRTVQRRLTGTQDVGSLQISVAAGHSIDRARDDIAALMRERRHVGENEEDDFRVLDTRQIAQTLSGTTRILTALLGAVAAVSLLVGGIGIMNIMLVSVTERTREIGIRLAIGALERDVLMQFLIEAVVLASLGGVLGILIATAASIAITSLMHVPYLFNPAINVAAFGFSSVIGVLFGYFPARRAARLDPIDALRHE